MNKNWNANSKVLARRDTLAQLGPIDGQYWSMCGKNDGPLCEYPQMIAAGVTTPEQWHGVEISRETHAINAATFPETNWHHGDLYTVMSQHRDFDPGLVNVDMVWMPEKGAEYVAKIMSLVPPSCIVVANFVMRSRYRKRVDADYVMDEMEKHAAFRNGWDYNGTFYEYPGTGRTPTIMGTFIFRGSEWLQSLGSSISISGTTGRQLSVA